MTGRDDLPRAPAVARGAVAFSGFEGRPGGRRVRRPGIAPGMGAEQTIKTIRAGRDEILDAAVADPRKESW